jgi:class 3 adenylate cyclase
VLTGLIVVSIALGVALIGLLAQGIALGRSRDEARQLHQQLDALHGQRATTTPRSVRAVRAVVETAVEGASRLREGGVAGLLTSSIEDLTRWALEDRSAIAKIADDDGTVTVLFSDIEDSTALNDRLGDDAWVRLLQAHDKVVKEAVARHRGHIVKSQGDGFMIVFRHAAAAVRAGIEIQDAIGRGSSRELRREPIRVRVGIHRGTAIEKDGDFFGRNVAMAARVAGQARGGQILVSDDVRRALRGVEDVVLVDVREVELKGLPGPHRLWEVSVL